MVVIGSQAPALLWVTPVPGQVETQACMKGAAVAKVEPPPGHNWPKHITVEKREINPRSRLLFISWFVEKVKRMCY